MQELLNTLQLLAGPVSTVILAWIWVKLCKAVPVGSSGAGPPALRGHGERSDDGTSGESEVALDLGGDCGGFDF